MGTKQRQTITKRKIREQKQKERGTINQKEGRQRTAENKERRAQTENQNKKKKRKNNRTAQGHTKEPKQSFGLSSITPPSPKSESKPGE